MTTEAQLLMQLRDNLQQIKGHGTPDKYVQDQVLIYGQPIVNALQKNHGHTLAEAIGLMRPVINELLNG